AGASCALALTRLDARLDVTLVDPDASCVTGPMSNAVIAGWRDLASITQSRAPLAVAGVRLLRARAAAIDADAPRLRLDAAVAPGIRLLWDTPEGRDESAAQRMPPAWLPGAQTELLARQLQALDDGGVVAISVPFGLMRCPPGPYERASVIAAWLRERRPRSK